jgi:YD repeat-containing protein
METTAKFLSLFVALLAFSCKKVETTPPCKLSTIDRGNSNKHAYTYDANGRITTMTREFDGTGSGNISKYVYSFTYDAANLLTKSTFTLDGKANGTESYTYTSGKISKVNYAGADGSKGVNNIKYDAVGRIIEFTYEAGDPNNDGKQYFEYDVNGIMTKRGFADLKGNKYFEVVIKPVGVAKSPENLLTNNGLPYDVLTGFSWQANEGNVGTISEVFFADNSGKLVSGGKDKITNVKTNSQSYIIESTSTDDSNKATIQKFTLTDCN